MIINEEVVLRSVNGISAVEKQRIMDFLQGVVYCWCKNRKGEWFAMRNLMGGENTNWDKTPLIVLYEKHEKNQDDPIKEAAKDSGWILKKVIHNDEKKFETKKDERTRYYKYIENND